MASDVHDLETDLLYLRKGAGVTPERMAGTGVLRLALGGDQTPYETLLGRLISGIYSLHEDDADLLLDIFGLTDETQGLSTLRERRKKHGTRVGRGIETVAARENKAITNLRNQLLSGWYPASPIPGDRVPEAHNSLVQEVVEVLTIVEDGRWQQTRERYRFLALFDEADYIRISNSFPGAVTPEPPFRVQSHRMGESYSHDFYLEKGRMHRGEIYDLKFVVRPEYSVRDDELILEVARAFHERTLRAVFQVIFLGRQPNVLWSFRDLTYFELTGNEQHMIDVGCSSSAVRQVEFRDLRGGLFAGLAWRF